MPMHYFFLVDDFEDLIREIGKAEKRIKDALAEMGRSCEEGGDTWHDNFGYEEAQRQIYMWSMHLNKLMEIRRQAIVVDANFRDRVVDIGRTVTVLDRDTGELKTFKIGSYMVFKVDEGVISYEAPLAKIILRARIAEERKGIIAKKQRTFIIIKIE